MKNKNFKIKWIKRKDLTDAFLIKGMPGVANISHISVDYLITKLKAELICEITSDYLPNIVLVQKDSTIKQPMYRLYFKKIGRKKILFLINNHPPKKEFDSHKVNKFFADFFKKKKIKQIITIAGISYKTMPKKIELHGVTTNIKLQKKISKFGVIFNGKTSVGLIIGSAGLLLDYAKDKKINGFCLLVSTWGNPKYIGIRESKKTIEFLSNYLHIKVDMRDLNKEIKRINKEIKKATVPLINAKNKEIRSKGMYIG